ncbi:MAG: adenylate kinase [Planctomycetota bacterium]|nr:MAG: adenylate kinase [Planctomycetota bacterium]REJ97161.1 MAG: adenylate kinase [Planctomycetota bacterium]REK27970.1 MAG: adenylate kinase [Planctomycetota bacterium]REK48712.1 MAG: adenylate kinase [Planctomycetota bacterium]
MRLVFIGPPGAGKGTQSEQIRKYLNVPHLATGDMLRDAIARGSDVGKLAKESIDKGELVSDAVVIQAVNDRLQTSECDNGVLFDGFPRTLAQAEALDRYLASVGMQIDLVLELSVDNEELMRRLSRRGRDDDTLAVIQQRLLVYRSQTAPLLDYYRAQDKLVSVDGRGTTEEVTARICTTIDNWRATSQS